MPVVPVTVILPVRNGAALIGEALQSVERQSWRPQEIIIMDGDFERRFGRRGGKLQKHIIL